MTEQQSWQGIAQSKEITYLQRLPEAIPEGQFLVQNSVGPTHPLGSHGFRAWLQAQDEHLEPSPSRLAINAADFSSRGGERMAEGGGGSVIAHPIFGLLRSR